MGLSERLERLAKALDRERWEYHSWHHPHMYNIEAVETADLLNEAAKALRGFALLLDEARQSMARH